MTSDHQLPKDVSAIIDRLRGRIRRYVWIEGIALAIIWLGLTFWIGLALDYLPVRAGANEMPRAARLVLLVIISAILLYILYRWVLRRAFVPLKKQSLALLVERQFPEFQDSLVTTVEMSEGNLDKDVDPEFFEQTRRAATAQLDKIELGKIFNYGPMIKSSIGAAIAVLSIVLFGFVSKGALATWASRMYLLNDTPWPRQASIELIGFQDGVRKVAEGGDTTILVRADANRATPPPEVCTIVYETFSGESGRVNMSKDGEPRDGYQHYLFDNPPFKGMLESVKFDVVGFDHRIRDYSVEVVASPAIVDVQVKYERPAYTKLPTRTEPWSVGMRLPIGSKLTVIAKTNKPIEQIEASNIGADDADNQAFTISNDRKSFQFDVNDFRERLAKSITLHDSDGITSQEPFRLTIGAVEDQAPSVSILLNGIGDHITPDARIETTGTAEDDYAIAKLWYDIDIAESDEDLKIDLENVRASAKEEFQQVLDLREHRESKEDPFSLKPGQKIKLTVRASDLFDLGERANIGISEEYPLNVVEPSELLARLEARELELRRRFEQIITEMTQTRDSLVRVKSTDKPADSDSSDPDDQQLSSERVNSLRVLRVQRARQQGEKTSLEIEGVAASFENIRQQLINNRVDSEERKERIEQQIVEPLKDIVDLQFPDWDDTLTKLATEIETNAPATNETTETVIRQTDEILLAMERILQKMEELESYNELVDLVRSIITEQEELLKKTKQERKKQARSLLD